MNKSHLLVFAAVAGGGLWILSQYFDLEGLDTIRVRQRATTNAANVELAGSPPVTRSGDTVRVASFNIQVLGGTKSSKPHVMDVLARVVRQFDVIAVQEVRAKDQDIIPIFVDQVNATGRSYDYTIGPRLGRTDNKEQYAFLFDRASIEVDRSQLYTIDDPDDILHREPLVGWFRVRGPPTDQAFTFSLVNIHTDPDETAEEINVLDDVFRAVRDDGRNEDDVIVLGDLNVDDRHMGQLGQIAGVAWVVSGVPTNTRGTQQYDNIVFDWNATREFVGRGGVFDFMREYNLSLEESLEVSDHLPVWAEFSIYEGGEIGRVAARPDN